MISSPDRSVAFIDIDGTILPKDKGIFDLGRSLSEHGLMDTMGVDQMLLARKKYVEGNLDYEGYATAALVALAQGLSGYKVESVWDHTRQELLALSNTFYPYTQRLIHKLQPTHDTFFVTANADFYAAVFNDHFRTTGYHSTELGIEGDRYNGSITRRMTTSSDKEQAIAEVLVHYSWSHSLALGDSIGDLKMLEAVEIPVAIDGDKKLLAWKKPHWIDTSPEQIEKDLYPRLGLS